MKTPWEKALSPLLKLYRGRKHPLDYKNNYQLLVMVILSARSTDDLINALAPALFRAFPNMEKLSAATAEMLYPYINKVTGFRNKASWLVKIAQQVKKNNNIPLTLDGLVQLPGIGRKSANVILREAGKPAEGVMVDLHVVRVAQRLGIAASEDPKIIESEIMQAIPQKLWGETGMALSYLGRETCRPKPLHNECVMKKHCAYFQSLKKK